MIIHKSHHFRTIAISPHKLAQVKRKFKNFCLILFDEWRCDREATKTWHKSDNQYNRFYAWSEFWLDGFLKFTKPLYTK